MIRHLKPTAPFSFAEMLRRPLSRLSCINVIDPAIPSYTRAIDCQTRVIPVTIVSSGTVEAPVLSVRMPEDTSVDEQAILLDIVGHMFSVHVDIRDFYRIVSEDRIFAQLTQAHYGLRPIQDANLFESMVKVIIGQQLNVQFAATLVARFIDHGAKTINWEGMTLPTFPSPAQVASFSYSELRTLSFSQRKAEYVIDFARAIVDGKVNLEELATLPDDEIYKQLTVFRGIGRWTVECFLLFGLGRQDVFPAADIGVLNAVKRVYDMDERPTEEEMRRIAQHWQPWRSYATYYLWQSLMQ